MLRGVFAFVVNKNGDSGTVVIGDVGTEESVMEEKEHMRFSLSPSKSTQSPPNFSLNDVLLFFAQFFQRLSKEQKAYFMMISNE